MRTVKHFVIYFFKKNNAEQLFYRAPHLRIYCLVDCFVYIFLAKKRLLYACPAINDEKNKN